jgi:predicted nucleic acid-binding protein
MRVILDTNVPVSALLVPSGVPATIHSAWLKGSFTLLISQEQIL